MVMFGPGDAHISRRNQIWSSHTRFARTATEPWRSGLIFEISPASAPPSCTCRALSRNRQAKPSQAEPSRAKPSQDKPSQAKPSQAGLSQAK
jgi:hypothetical protein